MPYTQSLESRTQSRAERLSVYVYLSLSGSFSSFICSLGFRLHYFFSLISSPHWQHTTPTAGSLFITRMRKRNSLRLFSRPHDHHIRTGFFIFFKGAPLKRNTVYVYGHSFDGTVREPAQPLRNSTGCWPRSEPRGAGFFSVISSYKNTREWVWLRGLGSWLNVPYAFQYFFFSV